ncbi:MAG: hypothetical protein U0800_01560 [Isosphaeraceae bacterium]
MRRPDGPGRSPGWARRGLLLPESPDQGPSILWHDGRGWAVASPDDDDGDQGIPRLADGLVAEDSCRPRIPPNSSLRSAWFDGLWIGKTVLQLVWGGEDGEIRWRRIDLSNRDLGHPQRRLTSDDGGYRHAALVRSGLVAGLSATRVEWIKMGPMGGRILHQTPIDRIRPIACCASEAGRALLVVGAGGEVVRLAIPPI